MFYLLGWQRLEGNFFLLIVSNNYLSLFAILRINFVFLIFGSFTDYLVESSGVYLKFCF